MPINKVVFGDTTLIDLSGDTIYSTDEVASGITYHDRWGDVRTGTLQPPTTIRPNNATPPAMNTSATYKVATSGYAIASYPNLLLDTTGEGQALTAGRIYYDFDEDGGYFFHEKPSGNLVETVLWTNPSPTSNFTSQNVTLSDSLDNYDYVKFTYYFSTSNTSSGEVFFPSDLSVAPSAKGFIFALTENNETNSTCTRPIRRSSDTVIAFDNCLKTTSGSGGTYNGNLIPTRIYGVKKSSSGGGENLKIIEPTVVAGDNTIETGVTIKQLVIMWQNSSGSHPNYYYVGEWNYQRPNYALRGYYTTSSGILETSLPYNSATAIKSVGTTSFVFNVHQSDINNIGGNPRCYIYY